jgi:hypothetical protein
MFYLVLIYDFLVVYTPEQQQRWKLPPIHGFDELLIKHSSWLLNASVHIFKGAPAVHLSYGRQRQILDHNFSQWYLHHACQTLQIHLNLNNSALAKSLNLCTKQQQPSLLRS